jgi:hypothetical protein
MSRLTFCKEISKAKRYAKLVECGRTRLDLEDGQDLGYVMDATDTWVLLQNVDPGIKLDGYTILRVEDISDFETEIAQAAFIEKALTIRKKNPTRPVLIDLTNIETIIRSIDENYPLITIHREEKDPENCWIGSVESLTVKTVVLNEINPEAKWDGTKRIRLDEITRIDFDGGYETALALVARL